MDKRVYAPSPLVLKKLFVSLAEKRRLQFYYIDATKDAEGIREIDPYVLGVNKQGNLFISGFFRATPDQLNNGMKDGQKNYLISQMVQDSIEVLPVKFDRLEVDPDKLYKTQATIVIAVAYFPEVIARYF